VEEEDVVEDWENADVDELANKIVQKDIIPAAGKGLRLDEEEGDDDVKKP
jgi:hypothetical protein